MDPVPVGKLITGEARRDAIHIAIAPAVAGQVLAPGQDIGFINGKAFATRRPLIGIVDPFLETEVQPEEGFYIFLYPNTIKSLYHHWTHPAFGEDKDLPINHPAPKVAAAKEWMQQFAEEARLSYATVMQAAEDWVKDRDMFVQHGSQEAMDALYSMGVEEFWHNYEIITGVLLDPDDKDYLFSCSC